MPFIRSLASMRCVLLAAFISLNSEIMSPYSYYTKKGLVYITIITPFSHQPSSYSKCTKANTCSLYNMRLVSTNKYISTFSIYIIIWLGYPLSYNFTGSISFISRVLILTQYKSPLSTCTILFIRSVTPTPSSISLSLKNLISKSLIRGVLCPILI